MHESGIRVLQFNPLSPLARRLPWSAAHRDHRKLLVVDGKTAILGGINISGDYSSPLRSGGRRDDDSPSAPDLGSWRDTDIQLDGPAVAECQKLFIEHWIDQKSAPLPPRNYFVTASTSGSRDREDYRIRSRTAERNLCDDNLRNQQRGEEYLHHRPLLRARS